MLVLKHSLISQKITTKQIEFVKKSCNKSLSALLLFLSLQPSLLKAIFSVDPDEVRSLIFKKEDVNIQVLFFTAMCG